MNYNLDFLITALVFLLLILYHFIHRRKLDDINSRIFRSVIFLGITDICFDILTTLLICAEKPELAAITTGALTIFYFLQVLVPFALFLYSRALSNVASKRDTQLTFLLSLPACIMGLLVFVNCWTGIFFYIDAYGRYIRGVFYLGMYAYTGLYGIIIFVCSLAYYRKLGLKNFGIMCEFLAIMIGCVAIQAVHNELLTTGLGLGLGITLLYLTINNPSEYTDHLTGDFNMQSFLGWLRELYWRKKTFHVITVNLQDLKQLNLLFGMRFGDDFLCEISAKLREILNTPYIFRVSSKRFVLFTGSLYEYERARGEILDLFHSQLLIHEENIQLHAIICGILDAQDLKNTDTLLAYIDYLVSLAPVSSDTILIQNDENTWKSFHYSKEIERFLRTAITEDLFEVYYQPVYSLDTEEFVALEALSRLKHPSLGQVPPDVFITIAERSGQISQIELLQFRRICSFVSRHPQLMDCIQHINFNLSPADLLRNDFSRQITGIIREFSLPFSFFQMEITETVATEYSDQLYHLTEEFKACGIRLSLDDFGSGYANLNTVLRLPFSCIKLDRSLLNGILEDKNTELFYKNIVASLKVMDYDVISEGVEHKKEVELLKSLGVNMIQGYYFSKPLPPEELLKLLGLN